MKGLYDLLEKYADRSYRAGEVNITRTLVPALKTPLQVIRQITLAVLEVSGQEHQAVLELCNRLWQEPVFECRLLAGKLLGQLGSIPELTILDTIQDWQPFLADEELQRELFKACLPRLFQSIPDPVFALADRWLQTRENSRRKSALLLLESAAETPGFDNGPAIFRRVSPFFRQAPVELRPAILSLLDRLAENFPQETTYILMESLTAPDNPDTYMLIRQVLERFPPELQTSLRLAIQAYKDQD
jgi:hypothetical protein